MVHAKLIRVLHSNFNVLPNHLILSSPQPAEVVEEALPPAVRTQLGSREQPMGGPVGKSRADRH